MNKYILPLLLFITAPVFANQRFECSSSQAAIVSASGDFDQFVIAGLREEDSTLSYVQLRYQNIKSRDASAQFVIPANGDLVYSLLDGQDYSIAFVLDGDPHAVIRNQGQYVSTEKLNCRFSR